MKESYPDIRSFCEHNGVELVAVSKTRSNEEILSLYRQGHRIFGENRVQELLAKKESLPKDISWHLVGHLQTNKAKFATPFISLIHSCDSRELLNELDKLGKKNHRIIPVLLQIHIADEETKFGLTYENAERMLLSEEIKLLQHISIRGLMGMATLTDDKNKIRREFRGLATFFKKMREEISKTPFSNCEMKILSMGMSGDYKIAVEEGSTMVRIGSALFGERKIANR